jgi:hypothetical protein
MERRRTKEVKKETKKKVDREGELGGRKME